MILIKLMFNNQQISKLFILGLQQWQQHQLAAKNAETQLQRQVNFNIFRF